MSLFCRAFRWVTLCVLGILLGMTSVDAQSPPVGIVFSKPDDPASALIIEGILAGIKEAAGSKALQIKALSTEDESRDLQAWIAHEKISTIITLGRNEQLSTAVMPPVRIIQGAVDLSPNLEPTATGVSLSVDPKLFFEFLNKLLPSVHRVFVVHERKDQWLIDLAKSAAPGFRLDLQTVLVDDFTSGAQHYKKIVESIKPDHDAVWLPVNDRRLDRGQVLPWLIEESWVRHFALLSNSLDDVRMGATLGLYPDPKAYGTRLWELAENRGTSGIEPARAIRSGVQLRFARHLGANLGAVHFDAIFPVE